ncbi:hybrid sensor histidine kinase/response regulator transcription factor [Pedobacter sp. Leaf132]|uniref:hybrid sensor histidine kinase/response regulator transcription factor n=1 Tax=Pedobacter sp. Leaf132 TaxID=2876557 RepID=UPI001E2FF5F6|nr:hybrid sensor histidine kinase/response regulator transcription factor [Pedobacter sp. Leaf132]
MARIFNFFLSSILLFLLSFQATAQLNFKSEFYSTENGLSHDAVTNIIKDREGFIWVGTWNGINRFDGHNFRSFKSFPGDLSHLKNDRIDQIVEDLGTNLWIKAYDNQIYRFNKIKEQFSPFKMHHGIKVLFNRIKVGNEGEIFLITKNDGLVIIPDPKIPEIYNHFSAHTSSAIRLPSGKINFVLEDAQKKVWIATDKGIVCLRKQNKRFVQIKLDASIFIAENFGSFAESRFSLFFGSDKGKLITVNKSNASSRLERISAYKINNLLASKFEEKIYASTSAGEIITLFVNPFRSATITHAGENLTWMFEDNAGMVWIEPEHNGVISYNPKTKVLKKISAISDDGYSYNGTYFSAFEDNKGRVWVNMKNAGFGYFEGDKTEFKIFNSGKSSSFDNLPNAITALFYEGEGVIWFSSVDRGVNKLVLQEGYFKQRFPVEKTIQKLDNDVRGIWVDKKNRLWLGQKSKNIYVFKDGKRVSIKFTNQEKASLGAVYCILEDSKNNIWLGTKANGLFLAKPVNKDRTSYSLTHFKKEQMLPFSLNSNEIYSLLEDKFGKIWIGTFDEGLNVANVSGSKVKFWNKHNGLKGYPGEGFQKIRTLALDSAGNVWIGTTDGLLIKDAGSLNLPGRRFSTYAKRPGVKNSLGNNDIQFIFRDHRNKMWLSTSGGGLDKALINDPFKKVNFKNYTTQNGLPNDYVLSCTEDHHGYIWAATQNGLSKFDPLKEEFTNYGTHNGLPKVTFSESSSQHFADESTVFGTNRGYIYFHPDSVLTRKTSAKMVFTNLQVNNVDQFPDSNGIIEANVNYLKKLKLNHDQNILSIDYAVLDSKNGAKQSYAYRLRGFETSWNINRERRRATYTNLPPGNYIFEVKSLDKESFINPPYKQLEISILPPPWKTWWAYLIYALITLALIEGARRIVLTMINLRNKITIEQKMAELKTNFFTNISHELRTPLTLILNPIEEIQRNEVLSQQGADQIEIVKKNSNRMIRFINQLLDLRKLESGKANLQIANFDLTILIKEVSSYFHETALKRNITLSLIPDNIALYIWGDREKLDVVIYNLLSNAFKFSADNSNILIKVDNDSANECLSILVQDQGIGVSVNKLEEIFNLYYQGNNPDDINQKGSGIGLALSKEIIELHGGQISAHQNSGQGLSIKVTLINNKTHFVGDNIEFVANDKGLALNSTTKADARPERIDSDVQQEIRLLLVEDNDDLRNFLSTQLSRFYQVETAADGAEGLLKAQKSMPDLIVSDVMMPVMSGIDMLDRLKSDLATSHIPVVLLSAKFSIEDQIKGLQYGADYYITKPFNNEFLIAAIAGLIKQRRRAFVYLVEKKQLPPLQPSDIVITDKDKLFMEKVIEIVEQNMENTDFNIDSVAEAIGMGRSTFYRKFKSLTDFAPVEFVRDMRLQRAKQFLDGGEKSISVIAYTVGFTNAKYFSTCFKEKYKFSPSEYLKSKGE